jgi:hypothetical protein
MNPIGSTVPALLITASRRPHAHAVVVGDVAGLDAAGDATRADFVGNAGRGAGVTHEQSGRDAARGQSHRGGGADAARCAGDDRGAATAAGSSAQER